MGGTRPCLLTGFLLLCSVTIFGKTGKSFVPAPGQRVLPVVVEPTDRLLRASRNDLRPAIVIGTALLGMPSPSRAVSFLDFFGLTVGVVVLVVLLAIGIGMVNSYKREEFQKKAEAKGLTAKALAFEPTRNKQLKAVKSSNKKMLKAGAKVKSKQDGMVPVGQWTGNTKKKSTGAKNEVDKDVVKEGEKEDEKQSIGQGVSS